MHRYLTTAAFIIGLPVTVAFLLVSMFRAMDAMDFTMVHLGNV
jgi:hypothetical protein